MGTKTESPTGVPVQRMVQPCDHIIGEWDDDTMESFMVRQSCEQPLGRNGTTFNFCPLCGERLNAKLNDRPENL